MVPWYQSRNTLEAHTTAAIGAYREGLRFHARVARIRSGTLRELGMTHARLRIIAVVAATPNLSIAQIARELDLSRQAVHRVVHDLERSRMLHVEVSPQDRRTRAVRLASLGTHIAALALPWERDWTSLIMDNAGTANLADIAALTRHLRLKLPWSVNGPDESAVIFDREPNPHRLCLMQ